MNKRPESVLVVIHCARSVLMVRRTGPDGFWQSVTGSLEAGELPRQTALREVAEETGIRLEEAQLRDLGLRNRFVIPERWRSRFQGHATHNEEHVFSASLNDTPSPILRSDEHDEGRWMPAHEALRCAWSWTNRDAIRLALLTAQSG
ncbi:MAG: dihydroneopterin triphosphate diphosphatase [Rhodocyclaceae bacterium]|nr:dihydroneopterin triphosphate diphosphatase [Rhodocyclaceae bacterium]